MLYKLETVKEIHGVLKTVRENSELYKETALIEGVPPSNIKIGKVVQLKISFIDCRPNYIMINVETSEEGIFILSDAHNPGWKAYLNDKPVQMPSIFGPLIAVFIPQGRHQSVFTSRVRPFYLGSTLTLLGFIGVGWLYFLRRKFICF